MGTYSSNTTIKVVDGGVFSLSATGTVFVLDANQYAVMTVSYHSHQDLVGASSSQLKINSITISSASGNSSTTSIGSKAATGVTSSYSQQMFYVPPSATVSFVTSGAPFSVAECIICYTIFQNTP